VFVTVQLIHLLHLCIVIAYIAAPIAAFFGDVRTARRRRRSAPSPAFVATICAGIAIGTSVSVAYAVVVSAHAATMQVVLASYFAASLLFILKAFDNLLRHGLTRLLGHRVYRFFPDPDAPSAAGTVPPMVRRDTGMRRPSAISSTLRIVLLFGL